MSTKTVNADDRIYALNVWLALADMPRATFYVLEPEEKPRIMKRGRSVFVLETPREWAERLRNRPA